jgi:5-methylcytosine-specific restriction endonuclease McrA
MAEENYSKYCPKCGEEAKTELKTTLVHHSPHYARLDCPIHGWIMWIRNPLSPKNRTTQALRIGKKEVSQVLKFHKMDKEICFLCLRTKEQLGECEALTIDHIIELGEGGKDIIENMQVLCSACHKLKNWVRLYLNWHLNEKEGEDDTTKTASQGN